MGYMENASFYIDESCHLEHDGFPVMCIGYIKIPDDKATELKSKIKEIKHKHGIVHEIKWNTISNTHVQMYKDLIDYFFASDMEFRCVLIKCKDRLNNTSKAIYDVRSDYTLITGFCIDGMNKLYYQNKYIHRIK